MHLAILYNARPTAGAAALDEAYEEYDSPETIAAIGAALGGLGAAVTAVEADADFPDTLRRGGFDLVFNIAEGAGRRCREAVPAAICEFLGLPFTGSDALTLAATLDKAIARRIVAPDVPVARGVLVDGPADDVSLTALTYPVVVKPNDEGSSKGIRQDSLCADAAAASARCRQLRQAFGCPVLVEEFLPGMEVTAAIRGNGPGAALIGLMEIAPARETGQPFLYCLDTKRDFRRQVRYHVPPRLPPADIAAIGAHALAAYRLLGCRDFARMDFRLDAAGRSYFLECNPLPGLHPDSSDVVILSQRLAGHDRVYERLVQGIVRDAARRYGMNI